MKLKAVHVSGIFYFHSNTYLLHRDMISLYYINLFCKGVHVESTRERRSIFYGSGRGGVLRIPFASLHQVGEGRLYLRNPVLIYYKYFASGKQGKKRL